MKSVIAALLLIGTFAHADTILVHETRTKTVATLEELGVICHNGLPPDGHHFPTSSTLSLSLIKTIMPAMNAQFVSIEDPDERMGAYCAALRAEIAQVFPADVKVTRTVSETYRLRLGLCEHVFNELVEVEVPNYKLTGYSEFIVEAKPQVNCAF